MINTQKLIIINVIHQLDNVVLKIEDTGCGIPKQEFVNVQNGKSLKHVGNGIGLKSARNYFSKINGRFDFKSLEHKGTTVTVFIPISIPNWLCNQIKNNENTVFMVVTDDMKIVSEWQKIFLL